MASRLLGIIAKEFIHLKRDMLALVLALAVPVAMLFIFGWAINTDVKHVPTAVFDQSGSLEARLFLEAMENSQYFDIRNHVRSHRELTRLIDAGVAKVGVVVPPDYAQRLTRREAAIQVIVDASDPQVATSALNAATSLGAQRSLQVLTETLEGTRLAGRGSHRWTCGCAPGTTPTSSRRSSSCPASSAPCSCRPRSPPWRSRWSASARRARWRR